jgi:hypothetical protein
VKDPELAEFYRRVCGRRPSDRASRKAIVAVARKLTSRIYAVLTERRVYKPSSNKYAIAQSKSNEKRRHGPEDDSISRRTRKYRLTGERKYSPVFTGSFRR